MTIREHEEPYVDVSLQQELGMVKPDKGAIAGPLAVATGASGGIGLEIARRTSADGMRLVVATDEPQNLDPAE